MRETLDLYGTLLRVAIAGSIQYRASGMVWMLGMIIEPVIYLVVWAAVAESKGTSVAGYDARGFAAYYLAFFVLHHLTFTWIMEVFQYRVQQGTLSFDLLRPIHPIYADIADNIAFKIVMLVVMIPAAVLLSWAFEPRFEPVGWAMCALPIALVLAFFTRFFIEWALALSAFWTTRTAAVNRTYYSVHLFLSGRAAPIALLPAGLATAAENLPFYSMIGFPVELALGRLSPERALWGLATQLMWALLALLFLSLVWHRAVRRFSAVGG